MFPTAWGSGFVLLEILKPRYGFSVFFYLNQARFQLFYRRIHFYPRHISINTPHSYKLRIHNTVFLFLRKYEGSEYLNVDRVAPPELSPKTGLPTGNERDSCPDPSPVPPPPGGGTGPDGSRGISECRGFRYECSGSHRLPPGPIIRIFQW